MTTLYIKTQQNSKYRQACAKYFNKALQTEINQQRV